MRPDYTGMVELPRSLLLTPVWASQTAWRVFSWLLLSATHSGREEQVEGVITRDTMPGGCSVIYTVRIFPHGQRTTVALSGDGAKAGALVRADLEQRPGQSFDTDNSLYHNRMDSDKHCSGSNPGAMNGADTGTDTGTSNPSGSVKHLADQSRKLVIWRWICEKCGTDSVGMIPAGVVPPPTPCLKSKWGEVH